MEGLKLPPSPIFLNDYRRVVGDFVSIVNTRSLTIQINWGHSSGWMGLVFSSSKNYFGDVLPLKSRERLREMGWDGWLGRVSSKSV